MLSGNKTSRVTLPVTKDGNDLVCKAGSLTFREKSMLDMGIAVRNEMRILRFRLVLDNVSSDFDYTTQGRS